MCLAVELFSSLLLLLRIVLLLLVFAILLLLRFVLLLNFVLLFQCYLLLLLRYVLLLLGSQSFAAPCGLSTVAAYFMMFCFDAVLQLLLLKS